jgi:hypothetical protein
MLVVRLVVRVHHLSRLQRLIRVRLRRVMILMGECVAAHSGALGRSSASSTLWLELLLLLLSGRGGCVGLNHLLLILLLLPFELLLLELELLLLLLELQLLDQCRVLLLMRVMVAAGRRRHALGRVVSRCSWVGSRGRVRRRRRGSAVLVKERLLLLLLLHHS